MSVINEIIEQWLDQGRAFTAYEVTLEARKQGEKGRHKDLKESIHSDSSLKDAVEFGDYVKTNVDVGASSKAILYHPDTYDPTSYQPLNSAPSQSTPSIPQEVKFPSNPEYCLDYRNRLFIPKSYLAQIAVPGENVSIFSEGSKVLVKKHQPVDSPLTTLKVEKDGEIRISQSTLISAGLTGNKFNLFVNNNVLEISI